jgi:NitT/TauT family transport system substrate-binding protein
MGAGGVAPAPLNPPVTIRLGDAYLITHSGLYVAIERGYFQEEGIELDTTRATTFGDELGPLAGGTLDIGWAPGADPGLYNALARGVGVRFVGCYSSVQPTGQGSNIAGLAVRQDHIDSGRYRDPADLKGFTVALPGTPGNLSDYQMERWLARGGLTPADYTREQLPIPDILPALGNKRVDAGYLANPFVYLVKQRGVGTVVEHSTRVFPEGSCAQSIIVSESFATQQREAVRRYVTAWLRGQRDYYRTIEKGEGDPGPILEILTRYTALQDLGLYEAVMMDNGLNHVDSNGGAPLQRMIPDAAPFQEYFVRVGHLAQPVDLAPFIDSSFLDYALQRLGRIAN